MIGKNQLIIDANNFLRGMSVSAESAEGGFSPETDAVNVTAVPGVLYAPANVTDKSTNLNDEIIAWCPTNVTNVNGFVVDTSGYVYSLSTAQVLTASAQLAGTYLTGTVDIINFIDKIYITSANDVARMDTNLTNGDNDWWSSTQGEGALTSGVRHPMVVYQDRLWVGDANAIHKITDSGTSDQDILVLNTHWEITALAVDPSTGRMLIAATQGANYSNTLASGNVIFVWDGTSDTYLRQYNVEGMVTGFHTVGGVVYVAYGIGKIGYWNGSGISFLRKLKNITLAGANLPYKHHMASIDQTLYIVDGTQILAFGEITQGQRAWYYALKNNENSNNYTAVFPVGSGLLGVSFSASKFFTFDTTSVASTGTMAFVTNKYAFPRPIFLREMYFEYADAVPDNDGNRSIYYKTEAQGDGFVLIQDPTASFTALKNTSGASVYFINVPTNGMLKNKVRMLQFRYNTNAGNYGLRRIVVTYDYAE
jgi:hypothetical protein